MSSKQRLGAVLASLGLLAALATLQTVTAQPIQIAPGKVALPGVPTQPTDPGFTDAITLPTDRDAKRRLDAAADLVREKAWGEAVRVLQSLLEAKEDAFIQVRRRVDNKETVEHISIKAEANRLIGTLPAEGLEHYQLMYGNTAADLLRQAREKSNQELLGEVSQKYLHTAAGAEAANLWATYKLDRGNYLEAAVCYERLINRQGVDKLPPKTLFRAALAFSRSGDKALKDRAEEIWKELAVRFPREGLPLGSQVARLEQLRTKLDETRNGIQVASLFDFPIFRGGPNRSAQGIGGAPFLEHRWTVSTLPPKSDTRQWVEQILARSSDYLVQRQQPVMPAFFPVAAAGKLVYRTYDGIYSVDIRTGKLSWMSPADGSLDAIGRNPNQKAMLDQTWLNQYLQFGPQGIFFENSVVGTLSTDSTRVYAIDDLTVPPPPQIMQQMMFNPGMNFGQFNDAMQHNRLMAFNIDSGKLVWWLGGRGENKGPGGDLNDSFFLGAPLPLGDKLYVLNEKNAELRLVCLDPTKDPGRGENPIAWTQTLATAKDRLPQDISRRIHAAHLAYGEGILVCPTNAGAVLGVDLLSRSLVWAHSYRKANNPATDDMPIRRRPFGVPQAMNYHVDWKATAPVVQDGKVIFAAPDGSGIHCLNLRDGKMLWEGNRENEDLFLAGVYAGKALIVGKNHCRALTLAEGKQVWKLENTGLPSGQGVASENVYYLPLKATADTKDPAVYAIDIEKGEIKSRTISRKKAVPGNLLFHEGDVVSQGLTDITAYPQLKVKLAQIDDRLKDNPRDPIGLTERAELRLDQGNLQGAVDDLHLALANNPPQDTRPKTRAKLYETLTELFQKDFGASEKYLDEYKDLCKVEVASTAPAEEQQKAVEEQRRRQANFLCLLGKGREKQGRLVDAFQAYMDFGALASTNELLSVIDEPSTKARPDVWARGRISAMLAIAPPDQRKPLEEKITQQWKGLQENQDIDSLRAFVSMFGSSFSAGRQARLHLAERLLKDNREEDLREAQLHLLQLRAIKGDPTIAGQAVESLARLMLAKGLLEHAAHYYRELGRDFAETVIREGKTGADFFSDLATDKRFLPYLDEPRQSWSGKIKASEPIQGQFPMQQSFAFEAEGDLLPFFQRHRLALDNLRGDPTNPQTTIVDLKVTDRTTNEEKWRIRELRSSPYIYNQFPNTRYSYQVKGHVAILNLAHMIYAFDLVDKKKLWEYNLFGPGNLGIPPQARVAQDRDGSLQIIYQDGWIQKLGQIGPIEANYVCLQTRNGLVAIDTVKGTILWSKSNISPRIQIFGDEHHVYLVEMSADGTTANSSKALRAQDGVSVTVPDFAPAYQRRVRILGHNLLVRDDDASGKVVLRLYDVHAGKDLWKKEFPANSVVLKTEEAELTGVIEPDGATTVIDLKTQKEILRTGISREHLEKVNEANLLRDHERIYIALNRPNDPQVNPWGGPWTNVTNGLRAIPVNGMVYAFDRTTGKALWWNSVNNQMLVLDQMKDLPILLFTAQYNKVVVNGPNRFPQRVITVKSIDKRGGKLVIDREWPNNGNQFYALATDLRAGTIDLLSYNLKIRHYIDNNEKSGAAAPPGGAGLQPPGGAGGQQDVAVPPVPPARPVRVVPIRGRINIQPAVPNRPAEKN